MTRLVHVPPRRCPWCALRDGLEAQLARWPLCPPPAWRHPALWLDLGGLVWLAELLTPAPVHTVVLGLVPVALAAWSGRLGWSLTLATVLPWGRLLAWGWQPHRWPLWSVLLNIMGEGLAMWGVALLMTALQRQAVRLALERDPRLPPAGRAGEG